MIGYIDQNIGESHSVVSDSLQPQGLYSPWNSPGTILEWVAVPFSRGLPNSGIEPRTPADGLQMASLLVEPLAKPQNIGSSGF